MKSSNEYMRSYMAARRTERRSILVEMLGGKCVTCGSRNNLEFDHKAPGSASFRMSGKDLDRSWDSILVELKKCQLLCHDCHRAKTVANREAGGGYNKNTSPQQHGTMRCYQETKCKCSLCVKAKRLYRAKEIGYTDVVS